jgi:hypothetical protein
MTRKTHHLEQGVIPRRDPPTRETVAYPMYFVRMTGKSPALLEEEIVRTVVEHARSAASRGCSTIAAPTPERLCTLLVLNNFILTLCASNSNKLFSTLC